MSGIIGTCRIKPTADKCKECKDWYAENSTQLTPTCHTQCEYGAQETYTLVTIVGRGNSSYAVYLTKFRGLRDIPISRVYDVKLTGND